MQKEEEERRAGGVVSNQGRRRRQGESSRDALPRFMTPDRCEGFASCSSRRAHLDVLILSLCSSCFR